MNRVKLIIIGAIALFIIVVFIIISLITGAKPPTGSTVLPNPTTEVFNPKELTIVSFLPKPGQEVFLQAQPVQINFSQPVNEADLRLQITPPTEVFLKTQNGGKAIIVAPVTIWTAGETQIEILGDTTSASGISLKSPRKYILHTGLPTAPPVEGAY